MKKNSVFSKGLSVFLAVLMVFSAGIVGVAPIAEKANAAISVEEDTGNPVFSLKWNVPESIYLKPGSGNFEYFLTNTLTASGATAIGDAAKSCDVTAVAPMADSMTLTYELEAKGKKPDGSEVSASGLSLNIANNVTGAQSLTNTLTGKALSGYTDAIAGNEYFIKWTMKFKVTTNGTQSEYTEYAYTSVYVPSLLTAGSSIFFKAAPTIGFKPRNSVYSFLTGGHTVSGGNGYASRFTSSNVAGLEANKMIHKDNLASATYVAPLVKFTGGNSYNGSKSDDNTYAPDYPFNNGATVPAGQSMYNNYTVVSQANGGVYATSESKSNGQWFQLSDMSAAEAPKLNITIDASRFSDYSQVPNLSAGWMQYGAYGIESGNRLRWIAGVNTGASYNGSTAKGMLTGDDAKEDTIQASKVAVSCAADTTDERSNYVSLARGLSELSGTVASGHNVMMYAYKTVYDGIGSSTSTNAVIAGVDLNVTATSKTDLRNAVYEAFLKGYAYKSGSDSDVVDYVNAILAADKVLADQFATAAEITAAYNTVKTTDDTASTKEKIDAYYKEGVAYDYVSFNVPETVYLNVAKNGSGNYDYQYVMDQSMTINPVNITVGGETHTMHAASLSANALKEFNGTNKGVIEFYYADVDTTKPVTLSCANGMGATYTTLTRGSDGKYTAYLTGGSASTYASGYITWYVNYTDKVDGYQKSAVGKTYVYAMPNGVNSTVAAQCFELRRSGSEQNREILNWTIWMTGLNGIGEQSGYTANDIYTNASYASPPLSVSTVVSKSGSQTDPKNADTLDGCYVSGENNKGYHGYWWKTDNNSGGTRTFNARWKAQYYFDTARFSNMNQFPNFKVGIDIHENWGGRHYDGVFSGYSDSNNDGTNSWNLGYFVSGGTANNTNILNTVSSSGYVGNRVKGRVLNTTPSIALPATKTTYVLQSIGIARNNGEEAKTTTNLYFDLIPVNKSDLRTSILNAQKKFSEYGVYYNGTSYESIYYNKDNADFNAFINAYDAAVTAVAKCDGSLSSEATTLASAITTLDSTIGDNKADNENHAIKKPAVSKQYNVSYDASGDKILRQLNNAEGKDVTFTENYFAKDDISYTAESYDGYDFLGFIKSTADLSYNGITGSQVMSGPPDYLTSVNDYQNQAVTTSSFGATSAVAYPNTVPAISNGSLIYSDTVDAAIYMIGVYQPHHYTVTYKANGGTGTDKVDSNVYGADYNLAASSTFTKENYNFVKWNTEADGSGDSYLAGAALPVADMPTDENGAITLYAQWQADPNAVANYTISIQVKNASGEYEQQGETVTGTGVNGDIINPSTAIDGLVFLASESTVFPYTLRAGQTNAIVLRYEYAKYTATFKNADGSATIKTQNDVPVGTTPTAPSNPDNYNDAAYHYTFAGWAQTANATTATGVVPMTSDGDVIYYAVFTAAAHTYDLGKYISSYDADTGTYYHQRLCDVCDRPEASMNAHSFGATPIAKTLPTCKDPGSATYKCVDCGFENTVVLDIDPDAHGELTHTAYKAETCTAAGNIEYWTCPLCGDYFSDQSGTEITGGEAATVIPAKGHDFTAEPTFNWSSDYATCTATYTCKNDATHKENKTCTVTSVTTDPTCTVDGYIDYTAKVTYAVGHTEYSDVKRGAGEGKLGHDFGAWTHTDGTLNADATHTRTCKRTGCTASESEACTFENVVTPATYKDQGYTTHTCTVCGYHYDDTYTDALGCDLTINYYFTGTTTKAAEPQTAHGAYGEDYNFASPPVTGYTASQTVVSGAYAEASKTVTVYYSANVNTAYTVKHYQQNADGDGYTLADTDNLTGTTGATTGVTAKTYTGFTAQTIDPQTIKADGSTVVNVYYNRDVYNVTWNVGTGATVTGQTTEVLYGNDIDFTVAYGTGYDQVKPTVTVSENGTLSGDYKITGIKGDITVNVPTQINTYTVAVTGDAGVTVSANATVNYGGSYTLTVTPKDNYKQTAPTATVNGADLALTKNGDVYTATIADIAEAKAIVVTSTIDSHTLTITYKYADNSEAAPTVTKSVNYGADYAEASPAITKFVPVIVNGDNNVVTTEVKGTMGTSDVTVNIVYLEDNNENGKPDVDDSKFTVTFDYGRYGTAVDGQIYAVNVIPNTAYDTIAQPTVNAKDGFTFAKWLDEGITTITGDITIYASYTTKDENGDDITLDNDTYLIRFVNYDGTLLKAIAADAGETISAPATVPTRGDFTFAGWDPAFVAEVTGDATYTATFKTAKTEGGEEEVIGANEYVVSFYTFDGDLIKAEFVVAGSTVTAPAVPARDGFTANGWDPAFNAAAAVNADVSYTASYKTALTEGGEEEVIPAGKFVIKFYTFDGKLLASFVKAKGETFTAPAVPDRANTTSKAWAPTVKTTVDGDAVYTATYRTKLDPADTDETDVPANSFVISFYTYDGQLIERQIVAANGDVIAPDAPARGEFSFAGWTPAFADKANADASYKATYKTKLNPTDTTETLIPDGQFVVSFVNYDGKLVEAKLVAAGETTTAPATVPTRANCTFKAWSPAFSAAAPVTEDKTYTATYTTKDENNADVDVPAGSYVVKFFNYDDTLLKTFVVEAGEKVTAPTATRGSFTFAGWTPSFDAEAGVTADASYKATFKTALVPGGSEQLIPDGKFVVSFYTYTGRLIEAQFVTAGLTTNAPAVPARANCTANGWTPAFDKDAPVTADADYTAAYTTKLTEGGADVDVPAGKFVVRFVDFENKLIAAVIVDKNSAATAPDMTDAISHFDATDHYGFASWDKNFTAITADTTVKAQYGSSKHDLDETIIKEAKCLEDGSKKVFCTVCGYEETVTIEALGHKEAVIPAVAPTCTATGMTEGKRCERCEVILVAPKPIAAKGHTFGAWTIAKAATATEDGLLKRVCSVCLYEETKPYAKSDEYLVIEGGNVLPIGESIHIVVTRMPVGIEENVTWTTSDPSIAFPDEDGNITVLGMGQVTLTATTSDGLTITKTFYINDSGNTRVIKFNNIDKMHYILAGYYCVYASSNIRWSQDYALKFRVHLYQTFGFQDVIVRANGVELKQNADGTYTIPAGDGLMVITVEGAAVLDQETGEKISFWQMLLNFFRKIIDFFKNLFS